MTKISIENQIDAARRELRHRERYYPKAIEAQRLRPETAARNILEQIAICTSLEWLRDNRDWIMPIAEERRRQKALIEGGIGPVEPSTVAAPVPPPQPTIEQHPSIAPLLEALPGAAVAGVRDLTPMGATA